MIISRTPLRIPLGGGGTDLPSYYSRFGGYVISVAINKYNYVSLHRRTLDRRIKASFDKVELEDRVETIQHSILRESLLFTEMTEGIEIASCSDVPNGSGLGGSGSFTVGLLNALHTMKGQKLSPQTLAEQACHVEIDRLREPSGKQDQYISAFGGIQCMEIDLQGVVTVREPAISCETLRDLGENSLLFYTGISRSSAEVLREQNTASQAGDAHVLSCLHRIKQIGKQITDELEQGNTHKFGELMHEHWLVKKEMSSRISNSRIDRWYEVARANGAIGGKIMGAGNGGFFLFYCEGGKDQLSAALASEGLVKCDYGFDFGGTQIVLND